MHKLLLITAMSLSLPQIALGQGKGVGVTGTPPGLGGGIPPGLGVTGTPPGLGVTGTPPGLGVTGTPPGLVVTGTPPGLGVPASPLVAGVPGTPSGLGVTGTPGLVGVGGPPSPPIPVGISTSIGPVSGSVGTGVVPGAVSPAGNTSSAGGVSNTGPTTTGTAAAPNVASVFGVPTLPPSLGPLPVDQGRVSIDLPGLGLVTGVPDEIRALARGLRGRRDAPIELVENCRQTIATAALPYGAIQVDGAAAGPVRTVRGGYSLPVTFNVVYRRRGGLEARHATVNCLMNTAGQVVATR